MSTLLLDVGNTRIKAAWSTAQGLPSLSAILHGGDAAAALSRIVVDTPSQVWISSVLGAQAEAALCAAVHARWGLSPHFARAQRQLGGLRNAYDQPERLGVDRWLAMLASRTAPGAALIVDAGTALTADVIDASGAHRGGFIAAGLLTAQRAVLGATRIDARDAPAFYDAGLGTDTEACVRQGAMLGCLGAIDRAAAIAGAAARRLITGGDAPMLLPHLQGDWEHRPDLVLEGLRECSRLAHRSPARGSP